MHEPARCKGGRRGGCEVSTRDETVFRVTNSRYHANPSSDRVFFRGRSNDLTLHLSRRPLTNGANGMRDIEGKVAREAMSECGQRASFKAFGVRGVNLPR